MFLLKKQSAERLSWTINIERSRFLGAFIAPQNNLQVSSSTLVQHTCLSRCITVNYSEAFSESTSEATSIFGVGSASRIRLNALSIA